MQDMERTQDEKSMLPIQKIKDLDSAIAEGESLDLLRVWGLNRPLRVYVYEMPRKFTYDLLRLFLDTYEETSNLTSNGSPVHRLIEQHSVDYWLWADLLAPESERLVKTVVRVFEQAEADVFYIPFFTTISFFLLEKPQRSLLYRALDWVTRQPAWQRSGGRDHVLPVHHPWSFKSHRRFMKRAIWLLPDLDSTGNWYKPGEVSLEKDVVLPYVPNVEVCNDQCLVRQATIRETLLFFRGRLKRNAGGKVRSKLTVVLKDEPGVVMVEGSTGEAGRIAAQSGMRSSVFCLNPAGDTPSSARLFDAVVSGCIPVIVSDELEPPFEGILDYRKIAIFVSSAQAVQPGWLVKHLQSISSTQVKEMQFQLAKFSKHFEYAFPAQPLGPEDLCWRMIAGKVVLMKLHIRRSQRVVEGSRDVCTCDCRNGNRTSSVH
ncbi:hypothetical protein KP509_34G068200 [Ceratopteris richardii]|uniref:Exostosin GT47 domain-containing protein n=1 Tax=Ceratopteris richardii TaxID=49495 RepID=A0A8T2QM41_CERRI|nr:hypothetical protein KP509_34G068200 [Ceratopteris richardii]